MVFAVELMLPASNSRTLMPLGIASVVATYIGRACLGLHPAFDIPQLQAPLSSVESVLGLLSFLPFGVITGLGKEAASFASFVGLKGCNARAAAPCTGWHDRSESCAGHSRGAPSGNLASTRG